MRTNFISLIIILFIPFLWKGQEIVAQNVAITDDDTYTANPSAMLDVKSINKGVLLPRLTTVQRNLVSNPATGLLVFDTDENTYYFYNGTAWVNVSSGAQIWNKTGTDVHLVDSTNNVGVGTSNPQNKFIVKGDNNSGNNEAIFAVVSKSGDTLLAVYPDGTRIYVNDNPAKASGSKGGFAVGGFSPAKAGVTNEYLRVTPDSVRIYIEENSVAKASGSKGGFAVGGFSPAKILINDYLSVNSDSINVSKSLYIPRMTTVERDNLGFVPSEALIIFNTTDKCMQIYENSVWSNIWCFNCAPAFIIQPVAQTICSETNANFFVSLTGTNLVYQWQQSTDGGTTWSDISNGGASPAYSGVTSYSLSLANVPVSFNAYRYRCNVSAACPPGVISTDVILNVGSTPPTITVHPSNQSLSQSCTASFSITSPGYGVTYQWQASADGITWSNISNGGSSPVYSGTTSAIVSLSNAPLAYNNYQYRCIADNDCGSPITSNPASLSVTPIVISQHPADVQLSTSCTATFTVTSSGPSLIYLWQSSPDGTTWSDISNGGSSPAYSNATTASLSLSNVPLSFNNYYYRCIISHSCRPTVTSNPATLTVTPITISTQPVNQQLSDSYTATFSVVSSGSSLIYQWQQSSDNGVSWTDITNGGTNPVYSGATLASLSMSSVPPSYNAYKFRCIISHFCRPSVTSDAATLTISLATLTTTTVSGFLTTQATSGGNISSNGGAAVTVRGVCWSTSANPTIADNFTSDGTGTGAFTSTVTGLSPITLYYLRAYATNAIGTAYGNEISFTTLQNCGTVTDYDGNIYNTVTIGSQCWMQENLKTTRYADGTPLVDGTSAGNISGDYTTKYYFDYANNPANTVTYGKLYTWAAVMNSAVSSNAVPSNIQGVCPTGWHLPSDAEWNIMEKYLDSTVDTTATGWVGTDIGGKLKETGTTHWNSPNTGATNSSGFTAPPGGCRYEDGTFNNVGNVGNWWAATESGASAAWGRYLYSSSATVDRNDYGYKVFGFSVRCVKD